MAHFFARTAFNCDMLNLDLAFRMNENMANPPEVMDMTWQDIEADASGLSLSQIPNIPDVPMDGSYMFGWDRNPGFFSTTAHVDVASGTGLSANRDGELTGGTVTSFIRTDYMGRAEFGVFGFRLGADQLGDAYSSASGADDGRVLQQMLRGADTVLLSYFDDRFHGYRGSDRINGGYGNDVIFGDAGRDSIFGEAGNDQLFGGKGADRLLGGYGDDRLSGGAGRDIINGGNGNDVMTGGAKADTFVFSYYDLGYEMGYSTDTIRDFKSGQDRIDLSAVSLWHEGVNFIGNDAFGEQEGVAVRFTVEDYRGTTGDVTIIEINLDADADVEGYIRLTGIHHLTADDFIL